MNRLIIVGSPRTDGRSAHLADLLEPLEVAGSADDGGADEELDAAGGGVLDELFDSVESSGF